MAAPNSDDENSNSILSRRTWLKSTGAAVATAALLGSGAGGSAAAEYETITLSEGESKEIAVGAGETLENTLIDVSAAGADLQVRTSGSDWTVRNVAVTGQTDVHKKDGYWAVFLLAGNGIVENCYLGDGAVDLKNKAGMGVPSSHSGHVEIRNCYVANWSDNGIYASHTADRGNGTVHVKDSYFHDNNVTHVRIAADGSVAENCVIHNTNNVSPISTGSIHSKGGYTGYGTPDHVVEFRNCDVEITEENTDGQCDAFNSNDDWHPEMATIKVVDTEYKGSVTGPYVELASGNGNNPDLTIPSGVPTSAEAAASGTEDTGSDTGNGTPTATETETETETSDNVVTIEGLGDWSRYDFAVSGSLKQTTDNGATIDNGDKVTGHMASGAVVGGRDSFRFTGEITDFIAGGDVTVHLNGTQVDPDSFGAERNVLTVESADPSTWTLYRFTVDGCVQRTTEHGGSLDDADTVEGQLASGAVISGRDSFSYTGKVTGFAADGGVTVYRNGEEIDHTTL